MDGDNPYAAPATLLPCPAQVQARRIRLAAGLHLAGCGVGLADAAWRQLGTGTDTFDIAVLVTAGLILAALAVWIARRLLRRGPWARVLVIVLAVLTVAGWFLSWEAPGWTDVPWILSEFLSIGAGVVLLLPGMAAAFRRAPAPVP